MGAEFRKINVAMQSDPDFRLLPPPAQHLYYTLWCRPNLSYCGVVDWRPGRIAALAGGWSVEHLRLAADCLEARHFIITDEATEECLIRSWVRFDGLLKQPRVSVSFANAFHDVSSNDIRGVIVHEAQKHHEREPDLVGWTKDQVREVLTFPSLDPKVRATPKDPFGDGFGDGFAPGLAETLGRVSTRVSPGPTTATATATSSFSTSGISDPPVEADAPTRREVLDLCEHLATRIEENGNKRPTITKRWKDSARLLLDRDERDLDQAHRLIDWCQDDEFWRPNVMSMPKFREKYDQLRLKAENVRPLRSAPVDPELGEAFR